MTYFSVSVIFREFCYNPVSFLPRFVLLRLKNVFLLMFPVVSSEVTFDSAVTKSGTGTWGRGDVGTWDSGTRGRGDVGTWGLGNVGREYAQGLEDVGRRANIT